MSEYILLALLASFLSAVAQALLKKSSQTRQTSLWKEYCNLYVLIAYGIMAGCVLLMVVAYRGISYKYGPVMESLGYLFVMALGRIYFGERLSWKRLFGSILIAAGVILFSM